MKNTTIQRIIENGPTDWLRLTTHRLDIYNEAKAKTEFIEKLEELEKNDDLNKDKLATLPTAFDYIRLGHPLSSVLEWVLAKESDLKSESVISFSSETMPILAVLRKNKFLNKKTRIVTEGILPANFNEEALKEVYHYEFTLEKVANLKELTPFEGSTIAIGHDNLNNEEISADFLVKIFPKLGSIIEVLDNNPEYIKEIQHVRRRESIAMTPQNCMTILKGEKAPETTINQGPLEKTIQGIANVETPVAFGSCGLSVQYAIMMGLIHHANDNHSSKDIKFIVPPNCYGGTNDQARRVAACVSNVEIVDLPVDSGKDMVTELERILSEVASADAIPYIIAEIPTNPRVEIPELIKLKETLAKTRHTANGEKAVGPVFILDQTFCPNVKFFGPGGHLNESSTISYVSGSKFPSGGLVTAGYCIPNTAASGYMSYIKKHLELCDNRATDFQMKVLTEEMPSMNERIAAAYQNTRGFVDYIEECLPDAKINFVTHELASQGFTPSVFSLDLPTKGETHEERENHKRNLNHQLIKMMIEAIPDESKHCVSYGQLKGCYWTIPATSTQGTTKESDKDYIVRVSVAADFDLEKHKAVFKSFCDQSFS